MPSRGLLIVAVISKTQSPYRNTTDPLACNASLPLSSESEPVPTSRLKVDNM